MSEAKEGVVIAEKGKYYLDLAGARVELLPQMTGGEENLKALAGQKVEVLYSEPTRFVVGLQSGRRPPILCYIVPFTFGQQGGVAVEHAQEFHIAITDVEGIRRPIILCYVPAPELIAGIEFEVRRNVANQMLQEGYISADVHAKIVGGRTAT